MAIEITVPQLGESLVEATVGPWRKHEGEAVAAGEAVVELETDKVNLEVSAPEAGTLAAILKPEGTTVTIGEALATLTPTSPSAPLRVGEGGQIAGASAAGARQVGASGAPDGGEHPAPSAPASHQTAGRDATPRGGQGGDATPLARRLASDHGIDLGAVKGTGPGGRVTHEDVTAMIATAPNGASATPVSADHSAPTPTSATPASATPAPARDVGASAGRPPSAPAIGGPVPASTRASAAISAPRAPAIGGPPSPTAPTASAPAPTAAVAGAGAAGVPAPPSPAPPGASFVNGRDRRGLGGDTTAREERVRLSRRRQTIARRLVEAQHAAAMLTTFNEVDMSAIMDLRKRRRDGFKERHGVGLGFMSFFTRAVVGALKAYPRLNAELQGDEMVLKHYYDIGIAVSTDEGLVVPVVRDADRLTFAEIERQIATLAEKARNRTLSLDDLQGGTFTITNGGVFGSLLSTPILNGPQVGILGMHKIQERPIAVAGQVVIHPMMYVAVSYDHRIVDGAESVSFLVRIKELLEDPEALLLEG